MRLIADEGRGIIVYLRGHEGRGIGLGHKLRAYALQETGRDTVDANRELGLPDDSRHYGAGRRSSPRSGPAASASSPTTRPSTAACGASTSTSPRRVGILPVVTQENLRYLRTKRDRMGHDISLAGG